MGFGAKGLGPRLDNCKSMTFNYECAYRSKESELVKMLIIPKTIRIIGRSQLQNDVLSRFMHQFLHGLASLKFL